MDRVKRTTIIIGIYAGRSGSKSVVDFLCRQPNTQVSWEATGLVPHLALNADRPQQTLQSFYDSPARFVGDFDPCWLWVLDQVLPLWDVKIIYLHRDPEEIAESFWTYLKEHDFTGQPELASLVYWPFCSPKPTKDAIVRTVKEYQANVQLIASIWPGRIYQQDIGALDKMGVMGVFLDYIGIPREGRDMSMKKIRSWDSTKNRQPGMKRWREVPVQKES